MRPRSPGRDSAKVNPIEFDSTVDRRLVHRQAVSEVFLTDIRRSGVNAFVCGAQWPRWHGFYRMGGCVLDSLLVAETVRQLTILISHTMYEVPIGHRFLMDALSTDTDRYALPADFPGHSPANIVINVDVDRLRSSRAATSALRTMATFTWSGRTFAQGSGSARILSPQIYSRLRQQAPTRPPAHTPTHGLLNPVEVGHDRPEKVVLARHAEAGVWSIRPDTSNPTLFDHPLDHVPGILLLETVRQAARAQLEDPLIDISALQSAFTRIVELDSPSEVRVDSLSRGDAEVTVSARITQNGADAASVAARLTGLAPQRIGNQKSANFAN